MFLKKFAVLGLIFASAFALGGCDLYSKSQDKNADAANSTQQQQTTTGGQAAEETIITFSDTGITPAQVTVKSGSLLTFQNNSTKKVSVGSDPHPTHTQNPEITGGEFILDLEPGATSSVTMTKVGSWGFHDHLNPAVRGKVVVE